MWASTQQTSTLDQEDQFTQSTKCNK